MVNTAKLKIVIKENDLTQKDLADQIGIHEVTFYNKMKSGEFNLREVTEMLGILTFTIDPMEIFFDGVKPIIVETITYQKSRFQESF